MLVYTSDHNPRNLRDRFASNFDRGTLYKHGNVLYSLVEQFLVEWVDFFRENLTSRQSWVPKLVGNKVSIWKKIIAELFSISAAGRVFFYNKYESERASSSVYIIVFPYLIFSPLHAELRLIKFSRHKS